MASTPGTREIDRARCRALLAAGGVGRLAFCVGQRPVVLPVNYATAGDALFIRTGAGAKAAAAARNGTVAFEVDDLDPAHGAPWSVLVTGRCALVPHTALPEALALDLTPAAGTLGRDLFVRVDVDEITGRQLDGFGALGR